MDERVYMGDDLHNEIETLKTELVSVKIRLQRIENFILSMPNPEEYLRYVDEERVEPENDQAFHEAVKTISDCDAVSASLLQRRCGIGYARAARYMDIMIQKGLVQDNGVAKPKKVIAEKVEGYLTNSSDDKA